MQTLQAIYSYIIYLIPCALVWGVNAWFLKKSLRLPHLGWKIAMIAVLVAGCVFAVYRAWSGIQDPRETLRFDVQLVLAAAIQFVIAAVLLAAASPETPEGK